MARIVIFGNSGAGKSTLAKRISQHNGARHFDLDSVAWAPISTPHSRPTRHAVSESKRHIDAFTHAHQDWVIEGCYSDLLSLVTPPSTELVFLNLPIEDCINNAKERPWEPHKYASKKAQDANLNLLIDWISQYETRNDTFSKSAHQAIFDDYRGKKTMIQSNQHPFNGLNRS